MYSWIIINLSRRTNRLSHPGPSEASGFRDKTVNFELIRCNFLSGFILRRWLNREEKKHTVYSLLSSII